MLSELRRTAAFFRTHPIAKEQRLSTWRRWLSWQIRSRLTGGPKKMPWLEGATLVVEQGMTGATGNLYCGLHEFADMAFVLHFLDGNADPSALFLDVGANVGTYTVLASRVCGVHSIALEPGEAAYRGITRNIEVNGIGNLATVHQVAAGREPGQLRFSVDRDTPMNQIVGDDYPGQTVSVPVTTIDAILNSRNVILIKMDVEGHEAAALHGARFCLDNPLTAAILVEADNPEVVSQLKDAGFERVDYDPIRRRICPIDGQTHLGNHLWVRDAARVTATCQAARRFHVFGFEF